MTELATKEHMDNNCAFSLRMHVSLLNRDIAIMEQSIIEIREQITKTIVNIMDVENHLDDL